MEQVCEELDRVLVELMGSLKQLADARKKYCAAVSEVGIYWNNCFPSAKIICNDGIYQLCESSTAEQTCLGSLLGPKGPGREAFAWPCSLSTDLPATAIVQLTPRLMIEILIACHAS